MINIHHAPSKALLLLAPVTAMLFLFSSQSTFFPTVVATTCGPDSTPPLNGDKWADSGPKTLYLDPALPDQPALKQAINDFAQQTGHPITITSQAPPTNTLLIPQNSIIVQLNPAASPNSISQEQDTIILDSNGQNTHTVKYANINFNTGAQLPDGSPFYDPNQTDASRFVHNVMLHELGHAFGLTDMPSASGDNRDLTPGASIMNGGIGTNDWGPHQDIPYPGTTASAVGDCDNAQITSVNPPPATNPPTDTGGGSGGGSSGSGSGGGYGGGGGGWTCYSYDDWNDETNTLTNYSGCY